MTSTTATRIPTITATSTVNFYDVLSSDNKTHYPMLVEGPGAVSCGCPAGMAGRSCYHRNWAIANLIYIDPQISLRLSKLEQDLKELNEMIWLAIQAQADDEADRYATEELFSIAA